jgi:hypothetical protein
MTRGLMPVFRCERTPPPAAAGPPSLTSRHTGRDSSRFGRRPLRLRSRSPSFLGPPPSRHRPHRRVSLRAYGSLGRRRVPAPCLTSLRPRFLGVGRQPARLRSRGPLIPGRPRHGTSASFACLAVRERLPRPPPNPRAVPHVTQPRDSSWGGLRPSSAHRPLEPSRRSGFGRRRSRRRSTRSALRHRPP